MPDIGLPPMPPPDVMSQMGPSAPQAGGNPLVSQFAGAQPQLASSDITPKVMAIEPLLSQLATMVPTMAPDIDRLNATMKSRMGGAFAGLAGMAGLGGMLGSAGAPPLPGAAPPMGMAPPPMAEPAPGTPMEAHGAPPPGLPPSPDMGMGMPPAGPPPGPGAMPPPDGAAMPTVPQPLPMPPEMGLLDLSMALEMQLPSIGADDPSLLPTIQFFMAKMREEVPKVLNGGPQSQQDALLKNPAPTDAMLRAVPVTA